MEELKAHVRSSVSSDTPFHGHAFPSCHLPFHPKKKRVRGNALHQNKTVLLRPPLCLPKQNRGLGNWGPLLVLRSVPNFDPLTFDPNFPPGTSPRSGKVIPNMREFSGEFINPWGPPSRSSLSVWLEKGGFCPGSCCCSSKKGNPLSSPMRFLEDHPS